MKKKWRVLGNYDRMEGELEGIANGNKGHADGRVFKNNSMDYG